MCRDIAITNNIRVESQEEFRVWLQPRSAMGVDVQYAPRHATVVIVDDNVPSKLAIHCPHLAHPSLVTLRKQPDRH